MAPMRASIFASSLLAALLTAGAALAEEADKLVVGAPAPLFTMRNVNAERSGVKMFAAARYVGEAPEEPKKAVVLSFAASYCEPCKKELAELGALKPKLDAAGVLLAVVVVDTDPKGAEAMQKLTVETLKLPYPVLIDKVGIVARRYRATALPYTVIIGKDGAVAWVHSGFQEGALAELGKQLGL